MHMCTQLNLHERWAGRPSHACALAHHSHKSNCACVCQPTTCARAVCECICVPACCSLGSVPLPPPPATPPSCTDHWPNILYIYSAITPYVRKYICSDITILGLVFSNIYCALFFSIFFLLWLKTNKLLFHFLL